MIISFEAENYLSFLRPARVDLTVGATAPDNYHFVRADGARIAKIIGIYGANASGKTNLLRIVPAVAEFITQSFSKPLDSTLPFPPHFFHKELPVRIQVEFQTPEDGSRYRYTLEVQENRVISESLKVKTSKLFSRVFERSWDGSAYKVIGLGEKHAANLRENVSWLSVDDIARSRNAGMTAHDYDLSTLLLLAKKLDASFEPNILGVPEGMSEEQALPDCVRELTRVLKEER